MSLKKNQELWLKKFRFLTFFLAISGGINIIFLACFIFFLIKEQKSIYFQLSPINIKGVEHKIKEFSNYKYLSSIYEYSFQELASLLSNKQLVEEGYAKRDLALGCLITFHNFNIQKALSGQNLQKRKVSFTQDKKEVTLIAGLLDHHYESIIHYAFIERWPLTAKGLFSLIKKWEKPRDSSLEKAFMVTEEFYAISNLFNHSDVNIKQTDILDLICECSWPFIIFFVEKQKQELDFSKEKRLEFLLGAFTKKSKKAAELLLKTDFIYVTKRLADAQVLKILSFLTEKGKEEEQFCIELLKSSRSDIVLRAAAEKLYGLFDEKIPENCTQQEALDRFVLSEDVQKKKQEEKQSLSSIIWGQDTSEKDIHIVKEGENLWKIARFYKVDIDELMRVNKLQHDRIVPGIEIVIPQDR